MYFFFEILNDYTLKLNHQCFGQVKKTLFPASNRFYKLRRRMQRVAVPISVKIATGRPSHLHEIVAAVENTVSDLVDVLIKPTLVFQI